MKQAPLTPFSDRRFWIGCGIVGLGVALLIATIIGMARGTPDSPNGFGWGHVFFAVLVIGIGLRTVLRTGIRKFLSQRS